VVFDIVFCVCLLRFAAQQVRPLFCRSQLPVVRSACSKQNNARSMRSRRVNFYLFNSPCTVWCFLSCCVGATKAAPAAAARVVAAIKPVHQVGASGHEQHAAVELDSEGFNPAQMAAALQQSVVTGGAQNRALLELQSSQRRTTTTGHAELTLRLSTHGCSMFDVLCRVAYESASTVAASKSTSTVAASKSTSTAAASKSTTTGGASKASG
jgi:hypothetical protein